MYYTVLYPMCVCVKCVRVCNILKPQLQTSLLVEVMFQRVLWLQTFHPFRDQEDSGKSCSWLTCQHVPTIVYIKHNSVPLAPKCITMSDGGIWVCL